jgi:thioredoxin 1
MKRLSGGKVFCILAFIVSFPACSQKPSKETATPKTAEVPTVTVPSVKEAVQSGEIIECHSQTELEKAIADHANVLVDFHGEAWCGPCRQMNPVVKKMAKEINQVTFVKVNVDEFEPAGIKGVPTFVFYKNGQEIKGKRIVGSQAESLFRQNIMKVFELAANPA